MFKTLVYNPSVRVEVISEGKVYDISRDLVRGNVTRVTNSASQVSLILTNKNLRYNNKFRRMDRIRVWFKRVRWVLVFTGYLDSVPIFQLYPGVVQLRASCTLKRLIHTWWDPNLESSQTLLDQQQADLDVAEATGADPVDPATTLLDTSGALTEDAGLGEMLRRVLVNVGNWSDDDIHIQNVPERMVEYLAENIGDYENPEQTEAFRKLFGYNDSGSTSGGGGLGDATFTTLGPPADGSAYSMDELVAIVKGAGWSGDDVAIGASIIKAESNGSPSAINKFNSNGTVDRGLWQINSIHEHMLQPGDDWFDPAVSTRLARRIYSDSGNWVPWSTYNNGMYQSYMAEARGAVNKGVGDPPKGPSASVPGNNKITDVPSSSKAKGAAEKDKETVLPGDKSSSNPTPAPQIGTTGEAYGSVLGGEAPNTSQMTVADSIAAVALYKFPMMTYTSGERYTDSGFHSKLQAADISNGGAAGSPEMKQLAQWWYDNFFGKGLLELIHHPFDHNVISDTDYGTGRAGPGGGYSAGTMEQHRDHVHIAMDGVVSADGTTTGVSAGAGGGSGGGGYDNRLGRSLFDYIFDPTNLDQSGIAEMFDGERAPINDEPLIKVIKSICDSSLRSFQSTPDGGIAAFYPDYWGLENTSQPVVRLEDIELKEFHIDANDDALATHVYVQGNQTFARAWSGVGEFGWLETRGVATIENEWLFDKLTDVSLIAPEFKTKEEVYARYGVRPLLDSGRSGIMTPQMEFLAACKIFMEKWAEQYSTSVDFTFMPELFPGMRVELVGHNVSVYVQRVSHSFDFSNGGGFTTSAVVTAPSTPPSSSSRIDGSERDPGLQDWVRDYTIPKSGTWGGDGRNVR